MNKSKNFTRFALFYCNKMDLRDIICKETGSNGTSGSRKILK